MYYKYKNKSQLMLIKCIIRYISIQMNYRKRASTAGGGVGSKFAFGQFSYGVTHNVSDAWSKIVRLT